MRERKYRELAVARPDVRQRFVTIVVDRVVCHVAVDDKANRTFRITYHNLYVLCVSSRNRDAILSHSSDESPRVIVDSLTCIN